MQVMGLILPTAFCAQRLPSLPSIQVQQNVKHIQWMHLAGTKLDGIWYIRLGVQMPSTATGGVPIELIPFFFV
jgi:hypothetical protein